VQKHNSLTLRNTVGVVELSSNSVTILHMDVNVQGTVESRKKAEMKIKLRSVSVGERVTAFLILMETTPIVV
jgi:hypothetical protein